MNQRMNIYGFPHKALRLGLGKLSVLVGNLDTDDNEEVQRVQQMTNELSHLLDLHLHSEEDVVLPAVEAKVPNSTHENVEEHEKLEKQEKDLKAFANQLFDEPNPENAARYYRELNRFIADYYDHMDGEEMEINPIIWSNFEDQEIAGWHGQIMATMKPEDGGLWFKYIVPSLNKHEQTVLLGQFKSNVPAEVYQGTLQMLKPELTEKQFAFISNI